MKISDDGRGRSEREAKLDEDGDAGLELHVEVGVDANADLNDGLDGGNDRGTEEKRLIELSSHRRKLSKLTRFGGRRKGRR